MKNYLHTRLQLVLIVIAIFCFFTTEARAQEAGDAGNADGISADPPSMDEHLYKLCYFLLWESIDKEDMDENYRKNADFMVSLYCANRSASWADFSIHPYRKAPTKKERWSYGTGFINAFQGKHDPLISLISVQLAYASDKQPNKVMAPTRKVRSFAQAVIDGDYPPFAKAHAAAQLRQAILVGDMGKPNEEEVRQEVLDLQAFIIDQIQLMLDVGIDDLPPSIDEQAILLVFDKLITNGSSLWGISKFLYYEKFQVLAESLDVQECAYPWVGLILKGIYHNDCHHLMGRDKVIPVLDGKFHGMTREQHFREAEDSYNAAWELDSTKMFCAFHQMRLNNYNPKGFRKWFWKGHETNGVVVPGIYRMYRNYIFPGRKDADIREVLDFAYKMVDSNRFDTSIPDQFYYVIWYVRERLRRTDYREDKQFFEYLSRYCNGRAKSKRSVRGPDYWKSAIAIGALFTGREEIGTEMIEALGDRFDPEAKQESGVWKSELRARLSDLGIEVKEKKIDKEDKE